ncbi:coiled-coil domain-containing protein 85B-like [Rhineura floridana]|uniref:coiled-coil domain-containing protein 85B-like n=1 Tax=Rhineura floridana TaxID=261503 RepID=UPI002AC7F9CF|nr:coiled-coil domain-containing protein 85B-like [Rhineura floridana]
MCALQLHCITVRSEICELKAVNGWQQAENCDLCCFLNEDWLNEDRLKAKRLVHHWKLFGHHAAQVLCDEVAACLRKLAGLEGLQECLAKDNLKLKELCLALEEECASTWPDASPAGCSLELSLPCRPHDLDDSSFSTGSASSPEQLHSTCTPND